MKHIRKITAAAVLVLGASAAQAADVVIGVPNCKRSVGPWTVG